MNKEDGEYDLVHNPEHYTKFSPNVVEFLEAWCADRPHEWMVIRYVARARYKGNELQDLCKARWYLKRRIEELFRAKDNE